MPTRIFWPAAALIAVLLLLWAALASAPPLTLDLGSPGDARRIGGFYDAEQGGGTSFRWSGPRARLVLHGASPGPTRLELRLSGERPVTQGEPRVTLAHDEHIYAAFDVTPGWRVYHLLLPPGAVASATGSALPLELRSAVSRPGAGEAARDYRALGMPVDWVRLTPIAGTPTGALALALWLTWAVGVVGLAVGPRRQGGREPGSPGDCTVPASAANGSGLSAIGYQPLAILALGVALALWAWRDPFGLAWALPPTPWALGAATVALVLARASAPRGPWAQSSVPRLWELPATPRVWARPAVLLMAVFLLALGLRFFRLDELPFGLWRDEARHGLVALRMVEDPTYRPIYVLDQRVQLPGLGLYPFAAAVQLFGVHLWTLRVPTALAGAGTVLAMYAVGTRLGGSRAVGLLAALFLAASSWHLSISRLAFPTVFEPLLSLTAWWLILLVLGPSDQAGSDGKPYQRTRRLGIAFVAGVLLGLAAQTYHTGRVTPLAAVWLALLLLLCEPRAWHSWLIGVGVVALGFTLTVAPLVGYALTQPAAFNDRVDAVLLVGAEALRGQAPLAALDANLGRHFLMFTATGDANGRHHAPLRPFLDPVTGVGFLLGVVILLRSLSDWRSRFLLGALGIGLLPGLLAVDAPHAMRTFGAVAPTYLIAAVGWAWLLRLGAERITAARRLKHPVFGGIFLSTGSRLLIVCLAIAVTGLNANLYFAVMPRDPQVFMGFYPVQSRMGVYVRERANGTPVYVPYGIRDHPSFSFLAAGLPVETFEGATVTAPLAPGAIVLFSGYFAATEAAALTPILGSAPAPLTPGDPFPDGRGPTYYVYLMP